MNRRIRDPQTQMDELVKKYFRALARNRITLSYNPFRSLVMCATATDLSCLPYIHLTLRMLDTHRSVQSPSVLTCCARGFSSIDGSSLCGCYASKTGKQLSIFYVRSKNCGKDYWLRRVCLSACPSICLCVCLSVHME